MRKIISISLILLLIVSLLVSCTNTANAVEQHKLSKLTVIKEPWVKYFDRDFQNYLGEYSDLQSALDKIVGRYNETHDNEDLYIICQVLHYNTCFKNGYALQVEYYSKFFEKIKSDKNFDKETKESQKKFACNLAAALYYEEKQMESIEFFDNYLTSINNADEKVIFSADCFREYFSDSAPDPSHDFLIAFLEIVKELEVKYYNQLNNQNKVTINNRLSICYDKLGDEKTSEEYMERAIQIIQGWYDETNKQIEE